ncbi:hypothetical protein EYC84_002372 [Monilinia fructicola]|uniref:PRISE-like Rossmann-fold domain-containing protein n=1 Tax=Monilinia fructicola TaxID=38448 RepID=A0A5M9JSZ1_MONFR|nr:hypothetical protein EYC84_002372 [Monilinia fructicola]
MASPDTPKVALISGANGITGSAVLKQLCRNPIWTRIIAISRSPPSNLPSDPRIEFHSLDATVSVGEVAEALTSKGVTNVTHYFHYAYIHTDYDHPQHLEKMAEDNVPLFKNILTAVDLTSRDTLHRVILQTGGKNYGLMLVPPASEPMTEDAHRVTDPSSLPNFYYLQEDFLWSLSEERSLELEHHNALLDIWLCRKVSISALAGLLRNSRSGLALNEDPAVQNQKFNIVDDTVTTFRDIFEGIGKYFGVETKVERKYDLMSEVKELEKQWPEIVQKHGGKQGALSLCTWDAFVYAMSAGEWGSVVNMDKARKAGWTKKVDTLKEMEKIFDEMKRDGWIPDV